MSRFSRKHRAVSSRNSARREGAEKKPAESGYPGRFYKMRATIPAAEAFRPIKDGGCPLVRDVPFLTSPQGREEVNPPVTAR
jgi:hypothetical protein